MSGTKNPVTARRGPSLNLILTAVVVVVAAAVIGGILLANRSSGASGGGVPDERLMPANAHTLSKVEGDRVTLVEFLDYQCPACASYYANVTKKLEQDYQGRITIVTRNYPLQMHPLALPSAKAAEAAAKQGKYKEMYHALYDGFESWAVDGKTTSSDTAAATAVFEEYARTLGLDVEKFRADMSSADVQAVIDRDLADGQALGVSSTPTFFLNGEKFTPTGKTYPDVDRELRAKIDAALGG